MRAVVVSEYGGTPALAEVPTPQRPGHEGQILMKMRAAGMNPAGPHARQRRRLAARAGGISRWCSAPDGERRRRCAGEGDDEVLSRRLASFGQLLIAPIGSGRDARRLRQPSPRMRRWPVCRTASIRCSRRRSRLPGGSALALVELLEPLDGEDRAGSLVRARGVGSALYAARCERRGPGDRELRLGAAAGACAVTALPRPSITPRSLCRTRYDRRIRTASMRFLDPRQPGGSLFRARLARPAREVGRPSRRNTSPMSTRTRGRRAAGINFAFQASTGFLERLADALVSGRIVAPPITRIALEEAPAVFDQAQPRPR